MLIVVLIVVFVLIIVVFDLIVKFIVVLVVVLVVVLIILVVILLLRAGRGRNSARSASSGSRATAPLRRTAREGTGCARGAPAA